MLAISNIFALLYTHLRLFHRIVVFNTFINFISFIMYLLYRFLLYCILLYSSIQLLLLQVCQNNFKFSSFKSI